MHLLTKMSIKRVLYKVDNKMKHYNTLFFYIIQI